MGKYFKYAIGEILLVVIGILIAVQLNNYNETREKQTELEQLLTDLDEYLDSQRVYMSWDLEPTKKVDSILGILLSENINDIDFKTLPSLKNILFDPDKIPFKEIAEHEIGFSNISNLVNRKEDFSEKNWSMIYDLESLLMYSKDIIHNSSNASQVVKNYRDYIFEYHPQILKTPSSDHSTLNDYLFQDPTFKDRMIELKSYVEKILHAYLIYNENCAKLTASIHDLILNRTSQDITNLWSDFNLTPLKTVNCNSEKANSAKLLTERNVRILVFNNSDDNIQYEVLSETGEVLKKPTIQKGVTQITTTGVVNVHIRYYKNDFCYIITNPERYGYLVIE